MAYLFWSDPRVDGSRQQPSYLHNQVAPPLLHHISFQETQHNWHRCKKLAAKLFEICVIILRINWTRKGSTKLLFLWKSWGLRSYDPHSCVSQYHSTSAWHHPYWTVTQSKFSAQVSLYDEQKYTNLQYFSFKWHWFLLCTTDASRPTYRVQTIAQHLTNCSNKFSWITKLFQNTVSRSSTYSTLSVFMSSVSVSVILVGNFQSFVVRLQYSLLSLSSVV